MTTTPSGTGWLDDYFRQVGGSGGGVNVHDFGAVGNGSTDCTAAVQAAVNALPVAGGDVYYSPGIYRHNGAVTTSAPVHIHLDSAVLIGTASSIFNVAANFRLTGSSRLASKITSASGGSIVNVTGSSNNDVNQNNEIKITDLTLVGGGGSSTGVDTRNISLGGYNGGTIVIEDCNFIGFGDTAIYIANEVNFVRVNRCELVNNNRGVYYGDNATLWLRDTNFIQPQGGVEQLFMVGPSAIVDGCLFGQGSVANVAANTAPDILIAPQSGAGFLWIKNNRFESEGEGNVYTRSRIKLSGPYAALPVWIENNAFLTGARVPVATSQVRSAGNLVTVTFATPHNAITGSNFNITSSVDTSFNGQYAVTVTDSLHFTYQQSAGGAASTSGGTFWLTNNRAIDLLSPIDRWRIVGNWFYEYGIAVNDAQVISTDFYIGESVCRDNTMQVSYPLNGYQFFTNGGQQFTAATFSAGSPKPDIRSDVLPLEPVALTNDLLYSEDFTNAAWVKHNSLSVTGAQTDPFGTTRACLLTRDGSSAAQYMSQQLTLSAGNYAVTFWAKGGSLGNLVLVLADLNVSVNYATCSVALTSTWKKYKFNVSIPSTGSGTYLLDFYVGAPEYALAGTCYLFGASLDPNDGYYMPTTSVAVSDTTYGVRYDRGLLAAHVALGSAPSAPYMSSGTGVPSFSAPNGSLYLRTDSANEAGGLYTRQAGAWFPISSWVPTNLPGLVAWYRADLGVTLNGSSKVTAVTDQSGTGNNLTSAGAGSPALTVANQASANNKPAFVTSGNSCLIVGNALVTGTDSVATYVAISKTADATTTLQGVWFDGDSSTGGRGYLINDGATQRAFYNTTLGPHWKNNGLTANPEIAIWQNHNLGAGAGNKTLNLSSNTQATLTASDGADPAIVSDLFVLGSLSVNSSPFNGAIFEFMAFNRVLSATEVGYINAYANLRYGISIG